MATQDEFDSALQDAQLVLLKAIAERGRDISSFSHVRAWAEAYTWSAAPASRTGADYVGAELRHTLRAECRSMNGNEVVWGTAGEWAGAIAVFITIAYTVVSTRKERRRAADSLAEERALTQAALQLSTHGLQLQNEQWQAELAERLRWQSKYVTCFVTDRKTAAEAGAKSGHLVATVRNDSGNIIFDVRGFIKWQGVVIRSDVDGTAVAPGLVNPVRLPFPSDTVAYLPADQFGVTFRDNAGEYWAKYESGHLLHLVGDHEQRLNIGATAG
jgi:hypothetical protein